MDYFFSDFYGFTVSPKLRYVVTVFGSIELTKITTFINSDVFFDSIIETVTIGTSEKIHKTCSGTKSLHSSIFIRRNGHLLV